MYIFFPFASESQVETLLRYAKRRPFEEIRTFITLAEYFSSPLDIGLTVCANK